MEIGKEVLYLTREDVKSVGLTMKDYIDLMEGIELSEIFPHIPIYMKFTDERIEQTIMISTTKTKKSLYSTGIIQDVLTKEYLDL